jgi:hypothetical protein
MPYYLYKIAEGPTALVKNLEMIEAMENFKEAKNKARELRAEAAAASDVTYKVIFAESELEAEERLQEQRDAPILQEWEK